MQITGADIEALELLVKSGKIAPQANWKDVLLEVRAYIIKLAKQLEEANNSPASSY